MNEVDWVILAVLVLSTGVGLLRGVVRELLAIVGWVVAIVLALRFSPELAQMIPLQSLAPVIRTVFSAIVIVVLTLFVIGMLGRIISRMLSAAHISFEDRAIGSLFGLFRGIVIVCACVFIAGMTTLTRTGHWRNSLLIVPAERIIDFSMPYMPEAITKMRTDYKVN